MATTAAVARNLLKNRSLPQILRGKIIGRSNVTANINNIAKDHQIVQSLFVSNQKIHAQIPIFDFPETGSLFGSYGGLSLVEKGVGHGMDGFNIKARGKGVEEDGDDDSDNEFDDDDDDDFDGELVDDDDDDEDEDDDDDEDEDDGDDGKFEGGKYKNKF